MFSNKAPTSDTLSVAAVECRVPALADGFGAVVGAVPLDEQLGQLMDVLVALRINLTTGIMPRAARLTGTSDRLSSAVDHVDEAIRVAEERRNSVAAALKTWSRRHGGHVEGFVGRKETSRSSDRAERRLQTVVGRVLRTQHTIALEIERNDGAYAFNDGLLDETEVCRRAGVLPSALEGSAHARTTRLQLETWLRKMQQRMGRGERSAQDVGSRTDDWKALLEQIAITYDTANIEVATLRERVKALKEREDALAKKHANLEATFKGRNSGREPRT